MCVGCGGKAGWRPAAVYSAADTYRHAGDLAHALQQAQLGFAAWQNSPLKPWHWKFRLLTAEILISLSRQEQAIRLLEDAPPPGIPEQDRIQARYCYDRSLVADPRKGDVPAAEWRDRAFALAGKSSYPQLLAQIWIMRGYAEPPESQDRAEEDFRAAVAAAEASGDPYLKASALGSMGFYYVQAHRYDEAMQWSQRSLEISLANGFELATTRNDSNLGWSHYRLGDFAKAESYFADMRVRSEKLGDGVEQQRALGNSGSVRYSLGDYAGALAYYQRALETADRISLLSARATWLNNIATTYIELGDFASAEKYNRQAVDLQDELEDQVVGVWPTLNAGQIALSKSDYQGALADYDEALAAKPEDPDMLWQIHAGKAQVYSRQEKLASARQEYEEAVAIIDRSWASLRYDNSKLTFPTRLTSFYRRYVDFLMEHKLPNDALNFVESRRALLLSANIGKRRQDSSFVPVAKESGSILLSYWLAPEHSYLWVTTPAGLHTIPLASETRIRPLVEAYSKSIQERETSPRARELYDLLIAPAQPFLPGKAQVVVVPDGCLHALNFETLQTPAGRYWVEDATIEVAPSLGLLNARRGASAGNGTILLIGDPVASDASLPLLPFAGSEISRIQAIYQNQNPTVRVQQAASPEAYLTAQPAQFSAIHFAAHAVPNRDSPLDSAVVLSPGKTSAKLYARQVQHVKLTADLVTISACQSAGARAYDGEGLVGFAWAFLNAGANHVVASLWDVSDDFTADFMAKFYARIHSGEQPAAALREVKLEYLAGPALNRQPYHWAPFQLYVR